MEPLVARWNALRERWAATGLRTRVASIAGLAALVAGGVLLYARSTETTYELLFANLAPEDAARIVERLREMRVPYELGDAGTSVRVPTESVHETRLALAAEGLPSGGGIGFELFDRQRFGESEFSEQVQFRRALEGELARTIRALSGVESARVHLVLPQRSLFASQEAGASASVVLRLRPGFRLGEEQVRGIVNLVAGSVRDLDPTRVTIVDGSGRPLAGSGTSTEEEDSRAGRSAEELRAQIEASRERELQRLLDITLGPGHAVVDVSAEVTFAREERLEEVYDPERVATRSFQITSDGAEAAAPGTQGVPGAVSALPGGAPAEPTSGGAGGAGARSELRNFEITKIVTRAVEPVGRVTRLHAAVVVDGTWEGTGDARHFVPRSEEELARLRAIVGTAAGIRADRGDVVTVECVPFAHEDEVADAEAAEAADTAWPWWAPWAAGAGVLGLFALAALVARRRAKARKVEAALLPNATPVPALPAAEGLPAGPPVLAPSAVRAALDEGMPEQPEDLLKVSAEIARAEPAVAARVIRAWLSEGTTS